MLRPLIEKIRPAALLPLILLVATIVRIAFIYAAASFNHGAANIAVLNGDERDYIGRAERALAGEGLTAGGANDRMWRTPAYPVWLAAVFLVFGPRQLAVVRLLQAALGGLVCVLIFVIARKVFETPVVALLSALWFAFYPPHVYLAGQILSENLLLPALLATTLVFIRLIEQPSVKLATACGILAGAATLVKPEAGGVMFVMVALVWLIARGGWRKKSLVCATLGLSAAIILAPWIARNHRLSGRFVISSVGGEAFWGGNNEYVLNIPKYHGYWMAPSEMPEQLKLALAAPTELEQDRMRWKLGMEFLNAHRADIPRLAWYKLKRFYSVMVQDRRERVALILGFGLLAPFIAAGVLINAWRFYRERRAGLILIGIIIYYNLLAIVFWGANRLRLAIDPFLIIFGVWAAYAMAEYAIHRSRSRFLLMTIWRRVK